MATVVWVLFALQTIQQVCGVSYVIPEIGLEVRDLKGACLEDYQVFQRSLNNFTTWAYKMYESSARSPTGVMTGSTYELGDFDECIDTVAPFDVQYCLVDLHLYVQQPRTPTFRTAYFDNDSIFEDIQDSLDLTRTKRSILHMGLCVPASCSEIDLENSINSYLQNKNHSNMKFSVKIGLDRCQTKSYGQSFTYGEIIFCAVIATLVIISAGCTIFDHCLKETATSNTQNLSHRLMLCCSLKRNYYDLLKCDDSYPALKILYGMKTFCILMIIVDHRIANFVSGPVLNREFVEKNHHSLLTKVIIFNGDLYVDSFFVLSGLLVTYTCLKIFEKHSLSPAVIIFARYIRLTPIFSIVVMFYATIFYRIGSGPLWKMVIEPEVKDCQANWWISLLYLGNYVNVEHMCVIYTWYLPCDFHFLILAVPLTMLIKKHQKIGIMILITSLILSILIPAGLTLYNNYPALVYFQTMAPDVPITKTNSHFNDLYIKSHTRCTTYIIGMFAGLLYYKLKKNPFKLSFTKSCIMIILGVLLVACSMSSGLPFFDPEREYSSKEAALYASLHRPVWALGTVILLFNASYGQLGIMKSVLNWNIWIPLSKLVYGAYLTHLAFQLRYLAMSRAPRYVEIFTVVQLVIVDVVLSFGVALFLNLTLETPSRKILKELIVKQNKNTDINSNKNTQTCSAA